MRRPMLKTIVRILPAVLFVWLLSERSAYAYLDPGSGSFLFQVIVGMGLLFLTGWKRFFAWLKSFFSNKKKGE